MSLRQSGTFFFNRVRFFRVTRGKTAHKIELAGGRAAHVLVVSIPDWSVTPFATRFDPAEIASEITRYNAVNREETQRTGARYIDITPNFSRTFACRSFSVPCVLFFSRPGEK